MSIQKTQVQEKYSKDDGTKMFITGKSGSVHEYSLSTAWDVSTASLATSFDTSKVYFLAIVVLKCMY